jgi:2-polyprenyl-3-methyl-5-hydroxy-6-metoxy-1,4-benzoquinol methylase
MNNFWNNRYSNDEYAYGTEPNVFFKNELAKLEAGKILLPGEGEGRNAVYAAKQGWRVTAIDSSIAGKDKAEMLSSVNNVKINYHLMDVENFNEDHLDFDCIALIFVHLPKHLRKETHQKLLSYIKPGGKLILEGFSKEQIDFNTGGPKNIKMLYSEEELWDDFSNMGELNVSKTKTHLTEGAFHNGLASTIRVLGTK